MDDEIIGVGITVVKTNHLNNILLEETGFKTGDVYLVDNSNKIITPTRFGPFSLGEEINTTNLENCWIHKNIADADNLIMHSEFSNFKHDANASFMGTHRFLPALDVCLIVEINSVAETKDLNKDIKGFWVTTFLIIMFLIVMGAVYNFSLTSTLRKQISSKTEELQNKVIKEEKTKKAMLHILSDFKKINSELKEKQKESKRINKELKILNKEKDGWSKELEKTVKKRTKELEKVNKKVSKVLKSKTEFLNQVAHDLRTPLTPIKILLDGVLKSDKSLAKDTKKNLTIVQRNVNSLSYLITEVLNLVRIESGKTKYNYELVDFSGFLKEIISNNEVVFKKKNVTLNLEIDKNLPKVKIDKDKIHEVIDNIISNSIKYIDKKEKILNISIKKQKSSLIFSLQDNGIGIEKKHLEKMFTEFYKVDQYHGGNSFGLGLSICKKIIESHGGKISVTSEGLGKGTTLSFSLPTYKY
ncbi:MAG: ATP-binding protein, partial [bacterium]